MQLLAGADGLDLLGGLLICLISRRLDFFSGDDFDRQVCAFAGINPHLTDGGCTQAVQVTGLSEQETGAQKGVLHP